MSDNQIYNSCPDCGNTDITTNTWEAWCTDCTWRITKDEPAFSRYRQADMRRRTEISEAIDNALEEVLAPTTPSPIELRARREALGLSQQQLATWLAVAQSTLAQWESGRRRIPGIRAELNVIEAILNDLVDDLTRQGQTNPTLTTYRTDEQWWGADPTARDTRLPATLHRVATARAQAKLHKDGIDIMLVDDPGPNTSP
jgi:DNA-binding transcriptional regulator YiaG